MEKKTTPHQSEDSMSFEAKKRCGRDVEGVWITVVHAQHWNVEMPKRIDWKLIIGYEIYELYTVFTGKWTNCLKIFNKCNFYFAFTNYVDFNRIPFIHCRRACFVLAGTEVFFVRGEKFNPIWSFGPDKKHKNWLIAVPCQSNAVYVGTVKWWPYECP